MKVWEDFLQTQVNNLGSEAIDKWAKSLKVVFFDAGNLYLEAQDSFQLGWFEEHLRPQVRQFFRNNNQRLIKVHLSLAGAPSPKDKKIWKPVLNREICPNVLVGKLTGSRCLRKAGQRHKHGKEAHNFRPQV